MMELGGENSKHISHPVISEFLPFGAVLGLATRPVQRLLFEPNQMSN